MTPETTEKERADAYDLAQRMYYDANTLSCSIDLMRRDLWQAERRIAELETELAWIRDPKVIERQIGDRFPDRARMTARDAVAFAFEAAIDHIRSKPPVGWKP